MRRLRLHHRLIAQCLLALVAVFALHDAVLASLPQAASGWRWQVPAGTVQMPTAKTLHDEDDCAICQTGAHLVCEVAPVLPSAGAMLLPRPTPCPARPGVERYGLCQARAPPVGA